MEDAEFTISMKSTEWEYIVAALRECSDRSIHLSEHYQDLLKRLNAKLDEYYHHAWEGGKAPDMNLKA